MLDVGRFRALCRSPIFPGCMQIRRRRSGSTVGHRLHRTRRFPPAGVAHRVSARFMWPYAWTRCTKTLRSRGATPTTRGHSVNDDVQRQRRRRTFPAFDLRVLGGLTRIRSTAQRRSSFAGLRGPAPPVLIDPLRSAALRRHCAYVTGLGARRRWPPSPKTYRGLGTGIDQRRHHTRHDPTSSDSVVRSTLVLLRAETQLVSGRGRKKPCESCDRFSRCAHS